MLDHRGDDSPTFESHGSACRIVAELWSFENIKHFVQQDLGLAVVPRITVTRELATVPVDGFEMPRRTLMICRAHGYLADSAQRFVAIAREFDWAGWLAKSAEPVSAMPPLRAIR